LKQTKQVIAWETYLLSASSPRCDAVQTFIFAYATSLVEMAPLETCSAL